MKLLGKSSISSAMGTTLGVVWILAVFTLAIMTIVLIAAFFNPGFLPLTAQPREYPLEITADDGGDLFVIEESPGWMKDPELSITGILDFKAGNRWVVLFQLVYLALMGTLWLTVLFQLRKFFYSLSEKDPFVSENARRLRIIGWATIGYEVGITILNNLFAISIANGLKIEKTRVGLYWEGLIGQFIGQHLREIALGFVILIIAEVFRRGALLKEEQELTV